MNKSETFTPKFVSKEMIQKVVDSSLEKLKRYFPDYSFDIEIVEDPESTLPELGIGGKYSDKKITLAYDPDSKFLKENLEEQVARSLAHEYIHAVREEKYPWVGGTLLEILVSEGLAQYFEMEFTQSDKIASYAQAINEDEILNFLNNTDLNSTDYDYEEVFFGSDKIKFWTGYAVGYFIVSRYLKDKDKKASDAVHVDSTEFI